MIKSFKSKALADLWSTGRSAKIDRRMQKRILVRLDRLATVADTADLDHPGYLFHPLKGFRPTRYSVHVNGPWCITFEFTDGDAYRVDFEQYH